MKRTVFIILATAISSTFLAQEYDAGRHSFTLQGSAYLNKMMAEEKVKDIYQGSLIYSYRALSFIEVGAGLGMGKGQYISLKDYYFAKDEEGIYPFQISNSFIGYNTVKCNFYDIFARAKLILYDGIISPFFLLDAGYSFTPYYISNFNLKGLYFTPSVGYDLRIFSTGKFVMIAGSDYQKIKYEKIETYFDVSDPENPEPIRGEKNWGLHDKFVHGIKVSIGFIYNPIW
jgi:hypothetical protein